MTGDPSTAESAAPFVPGPRESDITGPVRVDRRGDRVLATVTRGDIAVLDMIDVDLHTARALLARRPAAIINASSSVTGRVPGLGPAAWVAAGVRVVDNVGSQVAALLDDGEVVTVTSDGRVLRAGRHVASGRVVDAAVMAHAAAQGRDGLRAQLAAFGAGTPAVFDDEQHLLLAPSAVSTIGRSDLAARPEVFPPQLAPLMRLGGRRQRARASRVGRVPAVIVIDGPRAAADLRAIAGFARRASALVITSADGARHAAAAGVAVDVIIGDGRAVTSGAAAGRAVIHLAPTHVAEADVTEATHHLTRMGAVHALWRTGLTVDDAAVVLAVSANCAVVVVAGSRRGLLEFAEQRPAGMAGAALTRAAWAHRIVDASVAARLAPRRTQWSTAVTILAIGAVATVASVVVAASPARADELVTLGDIIVTAVREAGTAVTARLGGGADALGARP